MRLFLFFFFPIALFGQQLDTVDFIKISADILPNRFNKEVAGGIEVSFIMKQDAASVFLDAVNMDIRTNPNEKIKVSYKNDKVVLKGDFKKGKTYVSKFSYSATPQQTLYFTGNQIWTQGQGKYTSHWLPSIDDMNDKIEFDLTFRIKHSKNLIANGKLISSTEDPFGTKTFVYDMQKPMASYLVAFAAGDFVAESRVSKTGVPLELFIDEKHKNNLEATYRYTSEIFDFLENRIGVTYPWQNYKQVPVRDFLYAGMENTGCTIFSEAFVVDSVGFNDRNYVNVNAHELAHQWFGNLVTETSSEHHWLHEGFATYYAMLAEWSLFGDDSYYWKLYNSAEQLIALSEEGKGESLLNPKASSLTFYEKGAWALHMLNELIGEEAFDSAVKSYLNKHRFKNVTTDDFLSEVKLSTIIDISDWERDWLQQTAFKGTQAFESLKKSQFIQDYFEIAALRAVALEDKRIEINEAIATGNDYIGQEAVYQLYDLKGPLVTPLLKRALESDNLYIRQSVTSILQVIPLELQSQYEALLDDPSYVTQEQALFSLYSNYPSKRSIYLDKMDGVIGFQDKNVRQAWLALAIYDQTYRPLEREEMLKELHGYSGDEFSFEIRQKAFEYIDQFGLYSEIVLNNLVNASAHHNWRFRSFARNLLATNMKNENFKKYISENFDSFSAKEKAYLNKILSEN